MERTSKSGFPIDPVYDDSKLTDFRPDEKLGRPGKYPFTCGVYPRMYVDRPEPGRPPRFDPALEAEQAARLATPRKQRDATAVGRALSALKSSAEGTGNVLYPLRALRADSTLGEICDALRDVWGTGRPERI
jgi:methylmalonyl-CoA mutase N-terminal domain/subunit